MSTSETSQPLAASATPSVPQLRLLSLLLWERADITLEDLAPEQHPATGRECSQMIDSLRARPALPITSEQKVELQALGVDPAEHDRGSAGRILFIQRRREQAAQYAAEENRAATKLQAIFETAGVTPAAAQHEPAAVA